MSIASPRFPPSHARHNPAAVQAPQNPSESPSRSRSRSRSAILDFSPDSSQKRSLGNMHGGVEDQAMKKESPGKRERLAEPVRATPLWPMMALSSWTRYPPVCPGTAVPGICSLMMVMNVLLGRTSGSTSAVPKREGNGPAASDKVVLIDRASSKEASLKREESLSLSGEDGWTI